MFVFLFCYRIELELCQIFVSLGHFLFDFLEVMYPDVFIKHVLLLLRISRLTFEENLVQKILFGLVTFVLLT